MIDDPELELFRARQRSRSKALALVLGAMVILFFAITIVKIAKQGEHNHASAPLSAIKQS
ncbi:MAG: hypothetical protein RIS94_2636 [Pseudomonadota bacterium]|jgi:hypothetical protein